ncbi:PKD domain-containing protein, partial [Jatrophihabitans endophyticus]|uniref:PKD domain-containing protein n=1 Tax=Jatrophihabitans endophyticus TaxID=1206085 RepID=UPI0019E4F689
MLAAGPVLVPTPSEADSATCGGDPPCIVVSVDGSAGGTTTTTISRSTFEQDASTDFGGYTEYSAHAIANPPSGKPPVGTPTGNYPFSLTIAQVLALAQVTVTPSTVVTIPRTDGSSSALDADDVGSDPPYAGGDPPRFGLTGSTLQYLRPQLASDTSDANGYDLSSVDGGEFDIAVHEHGTVLDPVVQAPDDAQRNRPAQFGVLPDDPGATYTWQFGDGGDGQGAAPQHTYTSCGGYGVQVSAADPAADAYGTSDVVIVSICPPQSSSPGPKGGHGTGASSHPPTGPDKGSGHGGVPTSTGGTKNTPSHATAPSTGGAPVTGTTAVPAPGTGSATVSAGGSGPASPPADPGAGASTSSPPAGDG